MNIYTQYVIYTGGITCFPTFTGLPSVPLNFETLCIVFPTAVAVTMISIVATLFTRRAICETSPQITVYRQSVCPR